GARPEEPEGADDDQHVQAAADERLGRGQKDQEPSPRFGDDRAEAAGKQLAGRRRRPGGGLDAAFDLYSQEQAGGDEQRTGSDEEDDTGVGNGDEDAGDKRAKEGAEALERRGRTVGGDQLLRCPRERRQRRLKSRPEDRGGDADDASEGED